MKVQYETQKVGVGHYRITILDNAGSPYRLKILRSQQSGEWYVSRDSEQTFPVPASIGSGFRTKKEAVKFAYSLDGKDYNKLYKERYVS